MEEIKTELRQDNLAVKANAVAKLTYVSLLCPKWNIAQTIVIGTELMHHYHTHFKCLTFYAVFT